MVTGWSPAGAAGELSSPELTVSADHYFAVYSTPVVPQQHTKEPNYCFKNSGGRLQLNKCIALTLQSQSRPSKVRVG